MIVVKAELSTSADKRAAFLRQMADLVAASQAEQGSLSFGCYEAVAAPNTFIVLQEWSSRIDLDRHEASPHVAAFKTEAASLIVARKAALVYEVSGVSGL